MLDLSLSELVVIAVVAVLVVQPKDVPQVLRSTTRFFRGVQDAYRDVRQQVASIAHESGLSEAADFLDNDARYIKDQFGRYQRVYDLEPDLLKPAKPEAPQIEQASTEEPPKQ